MSYVLRTDTPFFSTLILSVPCHRCDESLLFLTNVFCYYSIEAPMAFYISSYQIANFILRDM